MFMRSQHNKNKRTELHFHATNHIWVHSMSRNYFDILFIDDLQVIHLRREHKHQSVHMQTKYTHITPRVKHTLPLTKPLFK